jgi:hypothetical protein
MLSTQDRSPTDKTSTLFHEFSGERRVVARRGASHTIPSGGVDPVTGFAFDSGGGFDSLVVGNNGDGILALLQGASDGLSLTSTLTERDVPSPTSLVFPALTGGQVQFFAATAAARRRSRWPSTWPWSPSRYCPTRPPRRPARNSSR